MFDRLIKRFVTECEEIVSPKLEYAENTAGTSETTFKEAQSKISKLEKIWQRVKKNKILMEGSFIIVKNS